ncbi:hypothetical protein MXB_5314 [Myxobolus squamalis]|nr:hypothetical protein MXB_5314 [Myxobolus squamalis]
MAEEDFWDTNWKPNGVPVKIDKYCGANVKNFIDDCIRDAKGTYCKQDFLGFLQFICIVVAILSFLGDKVYKYPFHHEWLVYGCVTYYSIYIILMLYQFFVINDLLLTCIEPEVTGLDKGFLWNIRTKFQLPEAQYIVELDCKNISTGKINHTNIRRNVGKWINGDGEILVRKIYKELKTSHDQIIGKITN